MLALCLCVPLLTACGEKTAEVTEVSQTTVPAEPIDEQVTVDETFTSADGTAEYTMTIDQYLQSDTLPVVEVVPHDLTEADVERVARAFFPDAVFYERTKQSDPKYTRAQLEYKISLLNELDAQGLKELYGHADQDTLDTVGSYIQFYTQKLNSAPAEEFREADQWVFRKEDYHCDYDHGDKVLCNTTMVDGIAYHVFAFTRNKGDYSFNRIFIDVGEGLGLHHEKLQLWAKLCRTAEPTQEQIDAVVAKAQQILDDMELGEWKVDSWEVLVEEGSDEGGHAPEYKIAVKAYPVVNGIPILPGQVCYDYQSDEPEASKCMTPDAYFLFAADGTPMYFALTAPIDEVGVVEEAAATLSMQELMEKAQVYLGELDPGDGIGIPFNNDTLFLMYGESSTSKIAVTSFGYGLSRRKAPGKAFHYYYVPTLVFYGSAAYYGADSGTMLASSDTYVGAGNVDDILWLDARDGTMIPQE